MRQLEVDMTKGEPVDRALKRLKGKLDSEGVMDEIRRLRAFETPTQKALRKDRQNARRNRTNTGVRFQFESKEELEAKAAARREEAEKSED